MKSTTSLLHVFTGWASKLGGDFRELGYWLWKTKVAGKPVTLKILPEDLAQYADWDSDYLATEFPPTIDVLTIHGLKDELLRPWVKQLHLRMRFNP